MLRRICSRKGKLSGKGPIACQLDGVGGDCPRSDGGIRERHRPDVMLGALLVPAEHSQGPAQTGFDVAGGSQVGGAPILLDRFLELE